MLADIWQIRGRDENLYFIPKDKHVCTNVISDFFFGVHHYEGKLNTCSFHELDCFFSWAPLSPLPPACLLVDQSHFQSYTTVSLCLDNLACMWGHLYTCVRMCIHVFTCANTCVYTKHEQKTGYCFLKTVNYQMAKKLT